MGKDKRKGKERGSSFDYAFGTGQVGELMKRYDIKGTRSSHPDGRTRYSSGGDVNDGSPRTREDVDKDIAKAMMNDYDTRRSMEAAAMAGDKEAKKFAKKGFKAGNIYSADDTMRELKKKYVGGGGMNGAKNRAGLTQAIVQADRDAHNADIDSRISAMSASQQAEEADKGFTYDGDDKDISPEMQAAKDRVAAWEKQGGQGDPVPYGGSAFSDEATAVYGGDDQQAETTMVADSAEAKAAGGYLNAFKEKMKQERNFKRDF